MDAEHKHKFKILRVEDHFLFVQIYFSCVECFTMCMMDRAALYDVLTDNQSYDRDDRW